MLMVKLFRKWLAAIRGFFLGKSAALNDNVHVIKATFEDAKNKLITRIRNINDALGKLIATKESKLEEIEELEKQCAELELALQGAERLGNKRGQELKSQGKTKEEILQDPEYIRCRAGYQDAESTLNERRKRIKDLEDTVDTNSATLATYQSELQTLKGELERLSSEEAEHIADVESTKALMEANEMLAGISENTVDKDLSEIRKRRKELRGQAKATQQLAGTDSKRATESFIEFAKQEQAASKFDSLMEWDETKPETKIESREASQLPE
jgi:predicted  nucleic acid-binding Zn-ribbon protein